MNHSTLTYTNQSDTPARLARLASDARDTAKWYKREQPAMTKAATMLADAAEADAPKASDLLEHANTLAYYASRNGTLNGVDGSLVWQAVRIARELEECNNHGS